jgi:hypothetical protein
VPSPHSLRLLILSLLCLLALALLLPHTRAQNPPNPWTDAQTVQPAVLYKELSNPKTASTVLFIGFQRLYTAGHIKGSQFHGQGGTADGLTQIKSWATSLPRTTNLVIYCGCCPMDHCPNIRPAFAVLRDMGFAKLRLLVLPTSFEIDWANKGLPYERGQ